MQYNLRIWFMFWWRWKSYSFTSHEDWGGRGGGERWKMKLWRNGKIIISKLNGSKLWRFCVLEWNKSEANWKLKGDARVSAKQRETWKSHLDYCRLVREWRRGHNYCFTDRTCWMFNASFDSTGFFRRRAAAAAASTPLSKRLREIFRNFLFYSAS